MKRTTIAMIVLASASTNAIAGPGTAAEVATNDSTFVVTAPSEWSIDTVSTTELPAGAVAVNTKFDSFILTNVSGPNRAATVQFNTNGAGVIYENGTNRVFAKVKHGGSGGTDIDLTAEGNFQSNSLSAGELQVFELVSVGGNDALVPGTYTTTITARNASK